MSKNEKSFLLICLLSFYCTIVSLLTSCKDDDNEDNLPQSSAQIFKVAVITGKDEHMRWKRTAEWALQNIKDAQCGLSDRVELQLDYYNQDAEDIVTTMRHIAEDTTIVAVVGPTVSSYATLMAQKLNIKKKYRKPMITPSATQTEYQRKFANTSFVWNMAESDISQLEVLIAGIESTTVESVLLLTANDGNDYSEWFGFIAEEYGLKIDGIYLYNNAEDIRDYVRKFCGTEPYKGRRALVFNPSDVEIALLFDKEIGEWKNELKVLNPTKFFYSPYVYCSDAFVSDQIASTVKNTNYKGVDLFARPESGFSQAYRQHFQENLINGEAQFYDALCLIAYAAVLSSHSHQTLNDAILSVVDGRDGKGSSWLPSDMYENFEKLSKGKTPDIDGVSSTWTFDEQTHSSVVESTFRRWNLYNGEFVTTEYVSTEGSKRSSSSKNIWNWTCSHSHKTISEEESQISYPSLDEQWALLISASKGWDNYRFQADIFAMYQTLKQQGYKDDHIILICEDDVAYNEKNPEQGIIRISDSGDNLYNASAIDYKLKDLTPRDLVDILQGSRSERLPHVLDADDDDNIFIFWSGHGNIGSMDWGGQKTVSYQEMKEILSNTPHRKMLLAVESCYSGGLGEYCKGLPRTLFITAASPYETSHADIWSKDIAVYRSNGFTHGFQEAINANPNVSLRDLYYTLAHNTSGSHVKVYNTNCYGSLYNNTMKEFLSK